MVDIVKPKEDGNENNDFKKNTKIKIPQLKIITQNNQNKDFFSIKSILLFLLFFYLITSLISSSIYNASPKIAVIDIVGTISNEASSSIQNQNYADSSLISSQILKVSEDNSVKEIILKINSGGGSPVASQVISNSIEKAKLKKNVSCVILDIGASGAYWIASSCSKIYSSDLSLIGSIGVTMAGFGFEQFIKKHNITYNRYVAGKYKDLGSPFKKASKDEEQIIQNLLDGTHKKFINHISKNRNLSFDYVKNLSTGEIFLGSKAKELKLIDEISDLNSVIENLKNKTGVKIVDYYSSEKTLFQSLGINQININLPNLENKNLVNLN